MKLISLLEKLEYTCLQGSTDQEVKNVIYDSRKVEEGSLFICIRGAVVDGHTVCTIFLSVNPSIFEVISSSKNIFVFLNNPLAMDNSCL